MRPPHGAVGPSSIVGLLAASYTVALWSVDSLDFVERDVAKLAATCGPDNVGDGDVVLLHEGQQWTLNALPAIVGALQGAGYELVTVSELMKTDGRFPEDVINGTVKMPEDADLPEV